MERKLLGMLLAAAFPVSSTAFAQAQPDASTQPTAAQSATPTPAPAPALGPSMTGSLHLNPNPLHVDSGPFGPIYLSGVVSGLGLARDHAFPGYGPGSGAWSLTLTPTWQKDIPFVRAEGSYDHAWNTTPGFGLGPNFNNKSQVRSLIEAGIIL